MKAKLATLITVVENAEKWEEIVNENKGKLLVVDVHKKWCGPCEVMRPTFENIFLETEQPEKKIAFLSVDESAGVESLAEFTSRETCKPLFLLLLDGKVITSVQGAIAPTLQTAILENLPELED